MWKILKHDLEKEKAHYRRVFCFIRNRLPYVIITIEIYILLVEVIFIMVLIGIFLAGY